MNPEDMIAHSDETIRGIYRLDVLQVMVQLSNMSTAIMQQSTGMEKVSMKVDEILKNHGKDLTELKEARANNARTISMLIAIGVFILGCTGWWIDKLFTRFEHVSDEVIRIEQRVTNMEKPKYENSKN